MMDRIGFGNLIPLLMQKKERKKKEKQKQHKNKRIEKKQFWKMFSRRKNINFTQLSLWIFSLINKINITIIFLFENIFGVGVGRGWQGRDPKEKYGKRPGPTHE